MDNRKSKQPILTSILIFFVFDVVFLVLSSSSQPKNQQRSIFEILLFIGIGLGMGAIWIIIGKAVPIFKSHKAKAIFAALINFMLIPLFLIESLDDLIPFIIQTTYHLLIIVVIIFYQKTNKINL